MKKQYAVILSLVLVMCVLFTGCSKEVTVDVTGLSQVTSDGAAVAKTGEAYSATLTAAQYYELPETITVTVDGAALSGGYTYDPQTGALSIEGESITGNVAIEAKAFESIIGTWKSGVDISGYMNTVIGGIPMMGEYFDFADLTMDFVMTFNEDGTFAMVGDAASIDTLLVNLKDQMKDGMIKMLEDVLAAEGVEMTIEEFLAASNMDMDELIEESLADVSPEEMIESMENDGTYKVEDGKLYLNEFEPEDAQVFEIKDGVMTLQVSEGDKGEEMMDILFPMVLKRVK